VLRLRKGDTLIVTEFSRLARSVRQVLEIIETLGDRGVTTHITKLNLKVNGKNDIATSAVILAMAQASQIERTMISDRTRAALARIKSEGKPLGMNAKTPEAAGVIRSKASASITAKATAQAENLRDIFQSMTNRSLTQRGMVEELNRIGIPAPRGGTWSQATVCRMLKRIG